MTGEKLVNNVNPWEERSKTKQDQFNKRINTEAAKFYEKELVPQLNIEIEGKLGRGEWVSVDKDDKMVVNFYYRRYLQQDIYGHVLD